MAGVEKGEHYDFVIIGTGLTETAVSKVVSKDGRHTVLHLDTAGQYGSEFATLTYSKLSKYLPASSETSAELLQLDRKFNIDLTPKLLLNDSRLKDFLVESKIHELVTFSPIKESYFYTDRAHKVPRSRSQALRSSAVSFGQKFPVVRFFHKVKSYAEAKEAGSKLPETQKTMCEEFRDFGINEHSMNFIGHAIALNTDDTYLAKDPRITYDRIVRYVSSVVCYPGSESPFIYPHYGLSEICQAFARRSALNGSVFMLNARILSADGNRITVKDPEGVVHTITAGKVVADPRYLEGSCVSKEIIRCILIMRRREFDSRCVIFLKENLKRKNDVFCVVLGEDEMVCPSGYEVAIISTVKETDDYMSEIEPVVAKFDLERVAAKFVGVRECYENRTDRLKDVIFTRSVDESPLMDGMYDDIERVLEEIGMGTGEGSKE